MKLAWLLLPLPAACDVAEDRTPPASPPPVAATTIFERQEDRDRMVDRQIIQRGVADARVVAAMRKVPRHRFVPEAIAISAYTDRALPIDEGQTISQPYIVAFMTAALELDGSEHVLEVGTGSGYQAAILAETAGSVCSIEIIEPLGRQAESVLRGLGYDEVKLRIGDGYRGWPEAAPFDAIIVTAAPGHVPEPLKEQLKVGGRLVIPVGPRHHYQQLLLITRTAGGFEEESILSVAFVPMTGEAEDR